MEINFPKLEKKILKYWLKNRIFEKSIAKRKKAKNFVFYDGPITVNARPGIHHVLARIYKDIIPRFKTMQGFLVKRKNGWDTHGLPVELEVEKELGFKTKKDIEKYGIAKFNRACRKNVQKYLPFFKDLTEKIGYWIDMENSYITYENDYIETVWWIIKEIFKKGLLYKDYKVVPYCPRCIDGNSKILTNPGLSKPIKELKNCWKKSKVLAFDAKDNRITKTSINEFIVIPREPTSKLSTVETQRSIVATSDHPFWVKGKGWTPLGDIKTGEKVAIYPYFEISEDKSEEKKILNEKELQNIITSIELKRGRKRIGKCINYRDLVTIDKWRIDKEIKALRKMNFTFREIKKKIFSKYKVRIFLNTIRNAIDGKPKKGALEYVIRELKNKDLLPLTTENPKLPIIARLLGHIFGDGFLMITSGKRINLTVGFTGKETDLNDIRNDLDELGFSYESIRKRFVSSILEDRIIRGYSTEFRVNSPSLAILLIVLGAPHGKKSKACFEVPKWLFKAPKHIIREFLAAYFGSELDKIKIQQKRGFDTLRFSLNKDEKLVKNGRNFIRQISELLKKFNVEIQKIRIGPVFNRKDGSKSVKITADFSSFKENLLNFCKFVGYRYSKERENFALCVRGYLELRKTLEKEKTQKYQKILKLKERGLDSKEISQILNIKTERIKEILNRKSKKDIRIRDIPEFKNWLRSATENLPNGAIWETVGKIKKTSKRNVFDFKVDKLHSFIVNGFITHNCGTSLSSHEVAQGYERIKEPAIYIKFQIPNSKFQISNLKTYLLVWTTTPWTLLANVAIAVNPDLNYVKAKVGEEILILVKEKLEVFGKEYQILEEIKGRDLIGLKYQPLFDFYTSDSEKQRIYEVLGADFVSIEEGTGIVHIAPAFGEEDMDLIKMTNSKFQILNERFPILLNVDEEGKFKSEVKKWAGMFVKDADPLIIEDLKERNLLFKEEFYEHEYPFCWRCDSPLLYYAKESWFINMQKVKKGLIKNNEKINWIPSHLKEGRFGEWLKEVKDWALSRERYWGTPLPIWQCRSCGQLEVAGSKKDLLSQKFSQNKYFILRHGQTSYQATKKKILYDWPGLDSFPLTEKGQKKIKKAAKKLKNKKIDLIYASDTLRVRQTAEIVSKELGLKIHFDSRLRDINLGIYQGREKKEFQKDFPPSLERFKKRVPGGESWSDIKKRMTDFIEDVESKNKGKTILIISHGDPLWILKGLMKGFSDEELLKEHKKNFIKTGKFRKIEFKNFSFDEEGNLDFHRPYIDEVKFLCKKCNGLMKRTLEVIDCWFDSGAMPFAQYHYPFENKKLIKKMKQFPADFIAEAIDQTRGWFYTLLSISTLLGFESPYKNVVCLGHVLDEKGEKMSKSRGNVVDPWYIVDKYGADSLRWYLYTVNQPGDAKLFSEKEVEEKLKKFLLIFWNCYLFFETYGVKPKTKNLKPKTKNVLDRWIISKLNELILKATQSLEDFNITSAARDIEKFVVEDLSQWYVRRSRARFHPAPERSSVQGKETKKDFKRASGTLGFILLTLSKLTAPFIPFLSEEVYKKITNFKNKNQKSVHLENWPKEKKKFIERDLNEKMDLVRKIVSLGLELRARAKIKVRQPLTKLKIKNLKLKTGDELLNLIRDELNVKEIEMFEEFGEEKNWIFAEEGDVKIALNIEITLQLKEEGTLRDFIRQVQEMRKKAGLKPKDKISIHFSGTGKLNHFLIKNKKFILKEVRAKDFLPVEEEKPTAKIEKEIEIEGEKLWLGIKTP